MNEQNHPYEIGKNYLIRTLTMCIVGKLSYVGAQELKLEEASWVADTGRFNIALKYGLTTMEDTHIEPFHNYAIVGRSTIVDATPYMHNLPRNSK